MAPTASPLVLVAALARNRVIGRAGGLPWRLPDDLRHFKELTTGGVVVMGRRTWESLGRPLPNRRNRVVSRQPGFVATGAEVYADLALTPTTPGQAVYVIGGGDLYQATLPLATHLELTTIEAEVEGDVWFPAWNPREWVETAVRPHAADARHAWPFVFRRLERVLPLA
jgi:dihydrofolate reductase